MSIFEAIAEARKLVYGDWSFLGHILYEECKPVSVSVNAWWLVLEREKEQAFLQRMPSSLVHILPP